MPLHFRAYIIRCPDSLSRIIRGGGIFRPDGFRQLHAGWGKGCEATLARQKLPLLFQKLEFC